MVGSDYGYVSGSGQFLVEDAFMVIECCSISKRAPSSIRLPAFNVSDFDSFQPSKSESGKRIVVVDDNPDICAFVSTALKGAGYEVETAGEGGQALRVMSERQAHLLITDLFMPGLEGFETIARCKAEFPHTTVMVMSAGRVAGMKHDFLAAAVLHGVAATLRKPFQADKLLDTVQRALQQR
jgi:DNA-binding NtrC family response regulator